MSQTLTINGVNVTLDPYVPVSTAVNGLSAQFQSMQGNINPLPIRVTFDNPVSDFGINIVGPTIAGNLVVGYDANGQQLTSGEAAFDANIAITSRVQITAPPNTGISIVQLIPAQLTDAVAYSNITLTPATGLSKSTSTLTVISPTQPSPGISSSNGSFPTVDLAQYLSISNQGFTIKYVKDSMTAIPNQTITLQNLSSDLNLNIGFRSVGGVSFSPSALKLAKLDTQNITVSFDMASINSLNPGISDIISIIDISSEMAVVNVPAPPVIPPAIPVVSISSGGGGAPPIPTQSVFLAPVAPSIPVPQVFGGGGGGPSDTNLVD